MITGGNATIFVANMDASLKFYSEVLGLKVSAHYGDHWASVEAGTFTIGLHPKSDKYPAPGTRGSMMIGLGIDESIDVAAARLKSLGVKNMGEVQRDQGEASFIFTTRMGTSSTSGNRRSGRREFFD